jgi:hypothetical protein
MIEYIKNIIPRIQGYSQKVDKEELLLNKTWVWIGFNTGYSTFHFLRDNRLLISQLGDVQEGKWEFIGNNHLLHIKGEGFNVLLNHGILFKGVLIMQKQGVIDTFEILYDEAVVEDGDVVKYIESHLPRVLPSDPLPVPDFPYNTTVNGVYITIEDIPNKGDMISAVELFSGKVTKLPKNYGIEVENNVITRVFYTARARTESGTIELEIDNLNWYHPKGYGYFQNNHQIPNGNYITKSIEPIHIEWKRLEFDNGRLKGVGYLDTHTIVFLLVGLLLVGLLLVFSF